MVSPTAIAPYAMFDYMSAVLFAHYPDNVITKRCSKQSAPVKVARRQTTPEPSRTFRTLPPEPKRACAVTFRNPPEPSEPCLWKLDQRAPELSRTLRNFPRPSGTNHFGTFPNLLPEPMPAYTGTLGTYTILHQRNRVRNIHQHTPEPSGTFWNLLEPASGTYTSAHRNPPEPSGTCLRNLHQHTPELSGTRLRNLHRLTPELSGPAPIHMTGRAELPWWLELLGDGGTDLKIKPCMSQHKHLYRETANGSVKQI